MTQNIQTAKFEKTKQLSPEIAEVLHMLRSLEAAPKPAPELLRG